MSKVVTIDIGNSRIKWACWEKGEIIARGSALHAGKFPGDEVGEQSADIFFQQLFSDSSCFQSPSLQVLAVCVADDAIRQSLDVWVEQNWSQPINYLQTQKHFKSITHAYLDPLQHGVDRWAALIAGQKMFPEKRLCIICAGTAITFDFIDQHAQHQGGYILPSFRSMHNALTADTSNVISAAAVFSDSGAGAEENKSQLPVTTNDAVNVGIHHLLQSGVRDICATEIGSAHDGGVQQIVITGGGAGDILSYPDMPEMVLEPDLVMIGLYEALYHDHGADD